MSDIRNREVYGLTEQIFLLLGQEGKVFMVEEDGITRYVSVDKENLFMVMRENNLSITTEGFSVKVEISQVKQSK